MLDEVLDGLDVNYMQDYIIKNKEINGIYFKINDKMTFGIKEYKKDLPVSEIELYDWCKKVYYYSIYIESNKAYKNTDRFKKVIMSCNENAIILNYKKMIEQEDKYKLNDEQYLKDIITGFFEANDFDKGKLDIFLKNIDNIASIICENKSKIQNGKIMIFLDRDIQEYKEFKLQDYKDKALTKNKKTDELGICSFFIVKNSKKPFLNGFNNYEENQIDYKRCTNLITLIEYLKIKKMDEIKTKIGKIKVKYTDDVFEFENIAQVEFDDIFVKNNLYIKNTIKTDKAEAIIKSRNDLNRIMSNVFYTSEDSLKYKSFCSNYKYLYESECDIKILNERIDNMFKAAKNLFIDDYARRLNIFNVYIAITDYLKIKNTRGELLDMNIICRDKMLNSKSYVIDNDSEFNYVAGILAQYYILKSKAKGKNNVLMRKYNNIKNTDKLLEAIRNDKNKYGYDDYVLGRTNSLFSALLKYKMEREKVEFKWINFEFGLLLNENPIFTKNNNNEENNDEK